MSEYMPAPSWLYDTDVLEQARNAYAMRWWNHTNNYNEGVERFDAMLAQVEAAAEQRGAIKALRDAAESPDLIGQMYREYDDHPLRSTLAPAAVRATSNYLHNRADQIEGDDHE